MRIENTAHVGVGKVGFAVLLSSLGSSAQIRAAVDRLKEHEEEEMRLKVKNEIQPHEFIMRPNPLFFEDYPNINPFERTTQSKKKGKNQRQKRKFNRQNPHSKKYRK